MIYLGKTIQKVFLIDAFTPAERESNKMSEKLVPVLEGLDLEVQLFNVASEANIQQALTVIQAEDLGDGAIIHLIGHGIMNGTRNFGFGNANFCVGWENLRAPLVQINQQCNDGLIMNTTMMCFGDGIYQIAPGPGRPYNTAFVSKVNMSSKCFENNKFVYQKCEDRDRADHYIKQVVSGLAYNHGGQIMYEINRI